MRALVEANERAEFHIQRSADDRTAKVVTPSTLSDFSAVVLGAGG